MFDLPDKILGALDKRMGELSDAVNSTYATNTMNEKTLDNWVGVDGMKEKVEYLRQKLPDISAIDTYKEYMMLMKYLALMIHINCPMRNDLADAKLVTALPSKQDEDINYIVMNKRGGEVTIYLNNFKTKKEYAEKVIKLPSDVAREIIKYSDVIAKMSPHGWFLGKDGKGLGCDKIFGRFREHNLYFCAFFFEDAHQLRDFVGSDASSNPNQDFSILKGAFPEHRGFSSRFYRR
jgi:hypothetical protein